ncbi:MAG: PTS sugar transporter subunit IIA, partial [Mariprofundaceae bacterium]
QRYLIPPDHVLLDSQANCRRGLITELTKMLPNIDSDLALEVIMSRERLGSTGIGYGVAIPHGKLADLSAPVLVVARHKQGIDFDAIDGKPVHIAVLLLASDKEDRAHLELLAHLARILQNEKTRQQIIQAEDAESISSLFPPLIKRKV